jgi:hypothetical protein
MVLVYYKKHFLESQMLHFFFQLTFHGNLEHSCLFPFPLDWNPTMKARIPTAILDCEMTLRMQANKTGRATR